jgi:hypothetical protein
MDTSLEQVTAPRAFQFRKLLRGEIDSMGGIGDRTRPESAGYIEARYDGADGGGIRDGTGRWTATLLPTLENWIDIPTTSTSLK